MARLEKFWFVNRTTVGENADLQIYPGSFNFVPDAYTRSIKAGDNLSTQACKQSTQIIYWFRPSTVGPVKMSKLLLALMLFCWQI